MTNDSSAEEVRALLKLEPHATCGFVRVTFISNQRIAPGGLPAPFLDGRPAGSALYFMVTPEAPVRVHRIRNDQLYHRYLGDPIEILMLHENGTSERAIVGPDLRAWPMRAAFDPGQYVPHCTRHRTTALVPRCEHRMSRRRESRRRNRRCRSAGGEISRRGRRSAIVPARVAAIDLHRLRAHFDVAVAKSKRAGQLTLLGHSDARLPASPAEARLETFPNPAPQRDYRIHFETDDFTSVCPVTGQPDFARIDIDYVPDHLCVESKSLKFYLASYRNERAFNEAVTNRILNDFVKACAPREATVTAQFSARGGIALTVRAEYPDSEPGRDRR